MLCITDTTAILMDTTVTTVVVGAGTMGDTMATHTDTDTTAARNVMLRLTPLSSPQHLLSQHLKFMPTPMPMDILSPCSINLYPCCDHYSCDLYCTSCFDLCSSLPLYLRLRTSSLPHQTCR